MSKKEMVLKVLLKINKGLIALFAILLIGVVVWTMFAKPTVCVSGHSMEPTFHDGDYLVAEKCRSASALSHGDIIVFLSPDVQRGYLIKRVIGLPGDTVVVKKDGVYVNDELLANDFPMTKFKEEIVTKVGEGEFFVLGDNRDNSFDSRAFGTVSESSLKFKVDGTSKINNTWLVSVARHCSSSGE